jgi:hypothetical protein
MFIFAIYNNAVNGSKQGRTDDGRIRTGEALVQIFGHGRYFFMSEWADRRGDLRFDL